MGLKIKYLDFQKEISKINKMYFDFKSATKTYNETWFYLKEEDDPKLHKRLGEIADMCDEISSLLNAIEREFKQLKKEEDEASNNSKD